MSNLSNINKNIKLVTTAGAKLNGLIHETAMMIAEHAKEHGDCSPALRLAFAMPASMRRTMLVLWFQTFTPIRMNLDNNKVGMLKPEQKGYTPFDLESGDSTPFFLLAEQNKEASSKTYDYAAIIAMVWQLSKRIDKLVEDGKVPEDDQPTAKAISERIASLKFSRVVPQAPTPEAEEAGKALAIAA